MEICDRPLKSPHSWWSLSPWHWFRQTDDRSSMRFYRVSNCMDFLFLRLTLCNPRKHFETLGLSWPSRLRVRGVCDGLCMYVVVEHTPAHFFRTERFVLLLWWNCEKCFESSNACWSISYGSFAVFILTMDAECGKIEFGVALCWRRHNLLQ